MTDNQNLIPLGTKVNGPYNCVRLEGNINGINKILYVFFETHAPIGSQTHCDDINSIDLTKYLAHKFKSNKDKMYDFFLETYLAISHQDDAQYKNSYLTELRMTTEKEMVMDPQTKKIIKSLNFPNTRFHYIDIRFLFYVHYIGLINQIMYDISFSNNYISRARNNMSIIKTILKIYQDYLFFKINGLSENNAQKKKIPAFKIDDKYKDQEDVKHFIYFIDKITSKYKYSLNQKILINVLKNRVINLITGCLTNIDNIEKLLNFAAGLNDISELTLIKQLDGTYAHHLPPTTLNKFMFTFKESMNEFYDNFLNFGLHIVDVFFMRRFLDKDYITHSITYTGGEHSMNYIYMLVKYYDFKITHSFYSKYDLDKTTKFIKNMKDTDDVALLSEHFYPPMLKQCVDMSAFPPNFS